MDQTLKADEIVREVKRAGIRIVVALPERMTSEHLLKPIRAALTSGSFRCAKGR